MIKSLAALAALMATLASGEAIAYPVMLKVEKVDILEGAPQAKLLAFSPQDGKKWARIPHQVDEVEDNAFLVLRNPQVKTELRQKVNHPGARDPFNGILRTFHRVVMDEAAFGACGASCDADARKYAQEICTKFGGGGFQIVRVDTEVSKKSAFLTTCQGNVPKLPPLAVKYDIAKRQITAPKYEVKLSETSPFLIQNLFVGREKSQVLQDGALRAKLKTKLLVNINVDEEDLTGWVTSVTHAPVATSLELAVNDKVLGFSTGKQVCCDITFFDDAFYFPIVVSPPERIGALRDGSGVTLGFNSKELPVAEKSGKAGSVLLFPSTAGNVAVAFRSTGTKPTLYPIRILNKKEELAERDIEKANSGLFLDLSGQKGEQRLEAWFFVGTDETLLREYALNGVRFTWKEL